MLIFSLSQRRTFKLWEISWKNKVYIENPFSWHSELLPFNISVSILNTYIHHSKCSKNVHGLTNKPAFLSQSFRKKNTKFSIHSIHVAIMYIHIYIYIWYTLPGPTNFPWKIHHSCRWSLPFFPMGIRILGRPKRGAARKSQKELNDAAVAHRAAETAVAAVLPSLPSDEEDGCWGWVVGVLGEGGK